MNIAIVDGYGVSLKVSRGAVVIKGKDVRKVVPLAEVDRIIVVSSGVSITSKAMRVLARYGIDVVYLDPRGVPIACLTPPWITATVDARRSQYKAYVDPLRALSIAKSFAEAKILNQGYYVRYLSKTLGDRGLEREAEDIVSYCERLREISGSLEEARARIMYVEAAAARVYWGAIASVLPRDLGFHGRDQDGVDQVNRALNYLYGVLYTECFKTLARLGLDPYAGFLHTDRSGNPTLVFDFVEMFRVSAVDSLLVKLFREGLRIGVDDRGFIPREDRVRLVNEFYRWVERRSKSIEGESRSLRAHIASYALGFARALRSGSSYQGFVERWWG